MANLLCGLATNVDPKAIQDTQANLAGSGDNIPGTNFLRISIGTAPGGPYTAWQSNVEAGTNVVGQPVQNTFGCTGSPPALTPSTQYYWVVEELDAGLNVIDTSSECTFTTLAASDYIDCDGDQERSRNAHLFLLGEPPNAPCDGSVINPEISTTPVGPWSPVEDLLDSVPGPCTTSGFYPGGFVGGASYNIVAWQNPNGLVHNTDYYIQWTIQKFNGDPDEVQVCGPGHTLDYPDFTCQALGPITTTTAEVNFNMGVVGQGGGSPWPNNLAGCNDDSYVLRWGTTPGGPYPNAEPAQLASNVFSTPTWTITGLTPNTTYYYIMEASEMQETGGIYDTTPECQFTTLAVATADCNPATNIGPFSATFNGTLHNATPGDLYNFEWGTTPGGPYPFATAPQGVAVGGANEPISSPSGPLPTGTTIYFRVRLATAGNADKAFSGECSFATTLAPTAGCVTASNIDEDSADLQVIIIDSDFPGWNYVIRYGTTPGGPYPSTLGPFPITTSPQGEVQPTGNVLTPSTQYYWIVEVRDGGNVVQDTSTECTFTTTAAPVTVDTDPPTGVGPDCITFNGTSHDAPAGCQYSFVYGTTLGGPYPFTTNDGVSSGANPESFSAQQCGLDENTTYYFKAQVKCGDDPPVQGEEQNATTTDILVDPCEPATNITPFSATLNATAQNVPAGHSYRFRYGTTPGGPYPNTVPGVPAISTGASPEAYSANIAGLTPGTQYYYTSEVLNPQQQVVAGGGECTFTTTGNIGPGGIVTWCGAWYNSADCEFVNTPTGPGPYFNCSFEESLDNI